MLIENIKIKYLREISEITTLENGDWIDLRAGENIILKQGDFMLIPLGVAIQLPKNYEALVVPRSSTFKKYGIIQTNGIGIIDETYCGDKDEWKMPVYATRNTFIPFNERICQFRIIKHQPIITLSTVEHLNNKNRGGFGSTDIIKRNAHR